MLPSAVHRPGEKGKLSSSELSELAWDLELCIERHNLPAFDANMAGYASKRLGPATEAKMGIAQMLNDENKDHKQHTKNASTVLATTRACSEPLGWSASQSSTMSVEGA